MIRQKSSRPPPPCRRASDTLADLARRAGRGGPPARRAPRRPPPPFRRSSDTLPDLARRAGRGGLLRRFLAVLGLLLAREGLRLLDGRVHVPDAADGPARAGGGAGGG